MLSFVTEKQRPDERVGIKLQGEKWWVFVFFKEMYNLGGFLSVFNKITKIVHCVALSDHDV